MNIAKRFSKYESHKVSDVDIASLVGSYNYNMLRRKSPSLYANIYNQYDYEIYCTNIINDLLINMTELELKEELIKCYLVDKGLISCEFNQDVLILLCKYENAPLEEIKTPGIYYLIIFLFILFFIALAINKIVICEPPCFIFV